MINESMARFSGRMQNGRWQRSLGKRSSNGKDDLMIVGVVADVHEENVDGEAGWQIYYPMTQAVAEWRRTRDSHQPAAVRRWRQA